MSQSTFVRASQIAQEIGITEQTLYRWVEAGKFPAPLRLGLRKYVWLRKSVDVYFDEKQLEAAEANKDTIL
jgi:predicted DNA-binding transcriptional regulator AlpA